MRQFAIGLIVLQVIWVSCARAAPVARPITAEIDATDILRGIQRAHLVIPVQPGSVTLAYPKWIPGEHAPTGPLTQMAGLAFSAQGTTIPWQRDVRDPFLFHIDVPQGADAIDVRTDIRGADSFFTDPSQLMRWGSLIPHEYVHSWNGKYRRPAGLVTRNYQEPMIDDLLWVYEGMTRYLGDFVLRARSGLRTPEQAREYVAWVAALMDRARPGRIWRTVGDTATALPGYNEAPPEWRTAQRYRDYYEEMLLVWLEADTIIRQKSKEARSLDDFCRAFFGGENSGPALRSYTRSDLVSALNVTSPNDWDGFLTSRVDAINPRAPLGGVQNSGWTLAYDDTPNEYFAAREAVDGWTDLSLSLGLWINNDGVVAEVVHGSPAFAASLAPTMRVKSINGKPWSAGEVRSAIRRAENSQTAIELVVESADVVRSVRIEYHDGLHYPHLVRDPAKPDLLRAILAPQAGDVSR